MKIEFEKDYLLQLYSEGKAKNKKHRFPKAVIAKYVQTINKLRAAERIEDLFPIKSLHYETLKGDKKDLESVRVNLQYRIEFRSTVQGQEPDTITICSIVELSNHYK